MYIIYKSLPSGKLCKQWECDHSGMCLPYGPCWVAEVFVHSWEKEALDNQSKFCVCNSEILLTLQHETPYMYMYICINTLTIVPVTNDTPLSFQEACSCATPEFQKKKMIIWLCMLPLVRGNTSSSIQSQTKKPSWSHKLIANSVMFIESTFVTVVIYMHCVYCN